ncbi:unnamed protein product [Mytilus edulis]|uniref:B box-type domain-containing protein n=1 Tax=Mytilus edulis TaxID=6550 RepID=A0A8S3U0X4_MYTED|nr:unnamed protein product [Mytilus edulis]
MATSSPVCGICDLRHISKPSVVWCPECDEGLCEDCKEHHTLSKSSRNHSVIDVSDYQKLPSDILKITLICSEHNEQYQMYCKKHESPCCRRCISKNHNSCKNRKQNIKSLKDLKGEIQIEIQQLRLKINSHLDQIQDSLIKKLDETEKRESKKICNLLKSLEKKDQEIKEFQSDIVSIKQYASDFQSFLAMKHIDKIATESVKYIQELLSSDNLKEMCLSLNLDTGIERFSSTFQKFGDICTDYEPTTINIVKRKNVQAQLVSPKLHTRTIDNINLDLIKTIKVSDGNKGCISLTDGKYALVNWISGELNIVNNDGSTESQINLTYNHFDATYNQGDNTIVVSSQSGEIHFVCLEKRKITKTISVGYPIDGIVYRDGCFIFCARDRGIPIMNIRDESVTNLVNRRISSDAYVTSFADLIYYTDCDTRSVICCNLQGKPKWTFKEENILPTPLGITVDNAGNVFVVNNKLGNVVVISPDGQKYRQLLSAVDGISLPWCITYDRTTDRLLVVNWQNNAYLYKITK